MNKEKEYSFIRLIKIERALFHLYTKLADANADTANKEKCLEYIMMTLEVEDSLFHQLDFTKKKNRHLLRSYLYSFLEEDWDKKEIQCIAERFQNYFEAKRYINPFKSMEKNEGSAMDENILIISNMAHRDYVINLLFLLNKEIKNSENQILQRVLEPSFHKLCFENKIYEQALISPLPQPVFNERKLCIDFGHKKEIVDDIYQELSYRIINTSITHLLQYPDKLLNESDYERAKQKVDFIHLKGASYLLNEEELYELYQSHHTTISNNIPNVQQFYQMTTSNILSTFKSSYEEIKGYQKKKGNK